MGLVLRALALGGLTVGAVAIGWLVLVVLAAFVLLWLLLQGESAVFGD